MTCRTHSTRHDVRLAIEDLIATFAWRIDHATGHGVEELFTEDGVYAMGTAELRGRDAIKDFYDRRREAGPRTSRHLFTNVYLKTLTGNHAAGTCVLTLHGANELPPQPLSPLLVADYDDDYVKNADGSWLFHRRSLTVIFGEVPQLPIGRP